MVDIKMAQGRITMARDPCMVAVRAELSKTRRQYFTFVGGFVASKIIKYLNGRIDHGEQLSPNLPVIAPNSAYTAAADATPTKRFCLP